MTTYISGFYMKIIYMYIQRKIWQYTIHAKHLSTDLQFNCIIPFNRFHLWCAQKLCLHPNKTRYLNSYQCFLLILKSFPYFNFPLAYMMSLLIYPRHIMKMSHYCTKDANVNLSKYYTIPAAARLVPNILTQSSKQSLYLKPKCL